MDALANVSVFSIPTPASRLLPTLVSKILLSDADSDACGVMAGANTTTVDGKIESVSLVLLISTSGTSRALTLVRMVLPSHFWLGTWTSPSVCHGTAISVRYGTAPAHQPSSCRNSTIVATLNLTSHSSTTAGP
ncbi:hypothetical protein MRX96_017208 [Rhipicephalus microplus]